MKKALVTLVSMILIVVIGYFTIGKELIDKYSYGRDYADMKEHYGVDDAHLAIILQDEQLEEQGLLRGGKCYLPLPFVEEYITDEFYYEEEMDALLYTTATDTHAIPIGEEYILIDGEQKGLGYQGTLTAEGETWIATDLLLDYAAFTAKVYDYHVQLYTEWGMADMRKITDNTEIRAKGGIKSLILRDLQEDESVEILEEMENWSKVKTSDSIIGYVENKKMRKASGVEETPASAPDLPEYTSLSPEGKLVLGFHAIFGTSGNDSLSDVLAEGKGITVIAPTWYSLTDNYGSYRSFASADYVAAAHEKGIMVWAVWDNFNYELESGETVDDVALLSSMEARKRLAQDMVSECVTIGADGINLDFEGLSSECGIHFVQFVKELSVLCRRAGIYLSIDNYVPFHFNNFYRLDIQGRVADFVLIMGYDEHTKGSGDPGSVASIGYVSDGLDATLARVPASKVINALPLYTILWKSDGGTISDEYITVNNQADFIKRNNLEFTWNEETCQNYATWSSDGTTYQIWLEDEESIEAKLNVMQARNIRGVAAWRLGYGTREIWQQIESYGEDTDH
jgi:spore germination protein YaaH